jgi:hypothetical protein
MAWHLRSLRCYAIRLNVVEWGGQQRSLLMLTSTSAGRPIDLSNCTAKRLPLVHLLMEPKPVKRMAFLPSKGSRKKQPATGGRFENLPCL